MNLFNKLPGFVRSAPGLEQRIWRRLPAILLWGTLLPLVLAGANHALTPGDVVLTVAMGCFIVRVMKGPAYVADAYPFPDDEGASITRP